MHSFIRQPGEQYKEMFFIRILNKCPSTVLSRSIAQGKGEKWLSKIFLYGILHQKSETISNRDFKGFSLKEGINKQESIGES